MERVHNIDTLQRTFRREVRCPHMLRGMGQELWNMAPERRTEPETVRLRHGSKRNLPAVTYTVRLRQVPPVIADRVTDPMRSGLRESDE